MVLKDLRDNRYSLVMQNLLHLKRVTTLEKISLSLQHLSNLKIKRCWIQDGGTKNMKHVACFAEFKIRVMALTEAYGTMK